MKKKILSILFLGILLLGITGCGNDVSSNEEKSNDSVMPNNDNNDTQKVENSKMTLENFRKVMSEQGLSIIEGNCTEKSINCVYTAVDETDDSRTTYTFETYRDEDSATRLWNNQISSIYEHYDSYNSVFKDDENKILEYTTGERGITIVYYYKTTSLEVISDEFSDAVSFSKVMKVLEEFDYTLNTKLDNTNNTNNTSSSDEKIKLKDYTVSYGTYKGTATSGGYTLTETVIISKDKMQIDDWETCEYEVQDNIIHCKQADAIKLKVIGNNKFTNASGIFTFELEG